MPIPLFPLPELVVFPGMTLPLFIFEERYRKMIRDCVEQSQRRVALVLAGPEAQISDVPELQGIAAIGSFVDILSVMENADGTFNVLTHGQERCYIRLSHSEDVTAPDGSTSQLHYTEDLPYLLERDDPNRERLAAWDALEVFYRYAQAFFAEGAQAQLEEALPEDLLFQASFICANLRLPASVRQELLEAPSLVGRFSAAQRRMEEQLWSYSPSTERLDLN